MYLLMAPRGSTEKGFFYGHQILDGKIVVFKQYWWHLFRLMGWRDMTPPEWGGNSFKPAGLKKILHVHHCAIGDMLFLTPIFKALAEKYPGIIQTVITRKKGASILEGNPLISEVRIENENPTDDVLAQFDDIINYDGMLTVFPESELMNIYDVAAEWAGIELPDHQKKPEMYFLEEEQEAADALLGSWGFRTEDKYVVMQYDASSNVRNIPQVTVLDLAEKITYDGYKVILFGKGDLRKKVHWRCNSCGRRNFASMGSRINEIKVACTCGASSRVQRGQDRLHGLYFIDSEKVTIRIIALLIKKAAAFVGPDSCGLHLAGCFDTPSLGIFFSFDGDLRVRYYRNVRCMQVDVPCGPCFQHVKRCSRYHNAAGFSRCVEKLTSDSIYQEFASMMRGEYGKRVDPFVPPPARACPLCSSESRYYVCRKKNVCYYECLQCGAFYADREVEEPEQKMENNHDRYSLLIIERRNRNIGRFLHERFYIQGACALEVQCGAGHTLDELQRMGWETEGIDISRERTAECEKRYPSLAGRLSSAAFLDFHTDRCYTLVWMNKVFERFQNPRDVFSRASEILAEGGVFAIQATDGDEWRKDRLNPRWFGINASYAGEYSFIPDEASLRILGRQSDLEFLERETLHEPGFMLLCFRKGRDR